MDKIMIIEDDYSLSEMISEHLQRYGFDVVNIKDFKNVEEIFANEEPHLVLLDINLPYYDGFYLCKSFRRKSNVPIIIVSSRNTEMEQIAGIELGADDYITKPFSCELLLAKIRALLRRTRDERSVKRIEVNGLVLDLDSFKLSFGKGSLDLSKNEFKLAKKLMENKDRIVSREELLEELWDDSSFVDDNTLTVNITRLKNLLLELGISDAIKTKKGTGYIFISGFIGE